jgi:hypothetical protein
MTAKVYDSDGAEKSWEWLQATYGNVRVVAAADGPAFRLTALRISHAEAVLQASSHNADGTVRQGDHVCNTWPGIGLDQAHGVVDLRGDPSLRTVYQPIACVQSTDSNGVTGFGLGTGSYIQNLADGGPHSVWLASPSYPSDVVCGLGMLGGTNHWGPLRPEFTLTAGDPGGGDDGGDPPPPPPDGTTVRAALATAEAALSGLDTQVAAALAAVQAARALVG